jgi:hypothetical protein
MLDASCSATQGDGTSSVAVATTTLPFTPHLFRMLAHAPREKFGYPPVDLPRRPGPRDAVLADMGTSPQLSVGPDPLFESSRERPFELLDALIDQSNNVFGRLRFWGRRR